MNINTTKEKIEDGIYEVAVRGSINALIDEKVLFLVEVEQAALFEIRNVPEEQIDPTLGITCPNIILPSLRYNLADILNRAGFQPINLSEINFRGIYEQSMADKENKAQNTQIATPAELKTNLAKDIASDMPVNMEAVVENGRVVVKPSE